METCVTIVSAFFSTYFRLKIDRNFKPDPLSPEAAGCFLGSIVTTMDVFTSNMTTMDVPLSVRLAYCGCVPEGVADAQVNAFYDEVLHNTWTGSAAAAIRVPYGLRERALWILNGTMRATDDTYKATLKSAQALHLIRTMAEFTAVKEAAKDIPSLVDRDFQGIKDGLVPEDAPLREWIGY